MSDIIGVHETQLNYQDPFLDDLLGDFEDEAPESVGLPNLETSMHDQAFKEGFEVGKLKKLKEL